MHDETIKAKKKKIFLCWKFLYTRCQFEVNFDTVYAEVI